MSVDVEVEVQRDNGTTTQRCLCVALKQSNEVNLVSVPAWLQTNSM